MPTQTMPPRPVTQLPPIRAALELETLPCLSGKHRAILTGVDLPLTATKRHLGRAIRRPCPTTLSLPFHRDLRQKIGDVFAGNHAPVIRWRFRREDIVGELELRILRSVRGFVCRARRKSKRDRAVGRAKGKNNRLQKVERLSLVLFGPLLLALSTPVLHGLSTFPGALTGGWATCLRPGIKSSIGRIDLAGCEE